MPTRRLAAKPNPERLVALRRGERFMIGPLTFDLIGAGVTSQVEDWDYFGFASSVRPSMFLRLAHTLADIAFDERTQRMSYGIQEGVTFGPIALWLDKPSEDDDSRQVYRVTGHEGRHRAHQILQAVGDVPVPIVVLIRFVRARNLTPAMIQKINRGLISEDGEYVQGPIFEGEAIYFDGEGTKQEVKLHSPNGTVYQRNPGKTVESHNFCVHAKDGRLVAYTTTLAEAQSVMPKGGHIKPLM